MNGAGFARLIRIAFLSLLVAIAWAEPPRRIVSTSPSITETLFALGLGGRVIGVSTYCHFPAETAKITRVGTYLKPAVEVIVRLKPDLVIVQRLPNSIRDQLQALSIPIAEVNTGNLRENLNAILTIGKAAQAETQAAKLVSGIETSLQTLRERCKALPRRSAVFIVGRNPGRLDGLIVVGGGSYLSELMTDAGGRNVFADSSQAYLKTSLESLLRRNPDVIIDIGEMSETVGVTEQQKQAVVQLWRSQPGLQAVKSNRVHAVASDIYVVPGPRMLDAARAFFDFLHPETAAK